MAPVLNEQSLRRYVAMEARAMGHGGVSAMARVSGLARSTIYGGVQDFRILDCAQPAHEPVISVDTKKKGEPQRHGRSSS